MPFGYRAAVGGLVMALALPAGAWGFVGGPGCTNLPLYHRALGALQGMTSACDMTEAEARRIIAEHDRPAAAPEAVPPRPSHPHRRHRDRPPHR